MVIFRAYMTRFCLRDKAFGLLKGWEQQGFGMVCKFVCQMTSLWWMTVHLLVSEGSDSVNENNVKGPLGMNSRIDSSSYLLDLFNVRAHWSYSLSWRPIWGLMWFCLASLIIFPFVGVLYVFCNKIVKYPCKLGITNWIDELILSTCGLNRLLPWQFGTIFTVT